MSIFLINIIVIYFVIFRFINQDSKILILSSIYTFWLFIIFIWKLIIFLYHYIIKKNGNHQINQHISDLGPIFIKFGQWISNRVDLLGQDLSTQLSQLQDSNKIHSWNYTHYILKKYLPDFEQFLNITTETIDSGSIAQVYKIKCNFNYPKIKANLNQLLALKIKHPNITVQTKSSIYLLRVLISLLKLNPNCKKIINSINFNQFFRTIQKQCSINQESNNLHLFEKTFKNNQLIIIPRYFYHNEYFLIESYEEGHSLDKFIQLYPTKKSEVLCLLWWTFFIMTLQKNVIHGDLHGGNYLFKLLDDKVKIILVDFGMISILDNDKHQLFVGIFDMIMIPNVNKLIDFIVSCNLSINANIKQFKTDINELMDKIGVNQIYNVIDQHGYSALFNEDEKNCNNIVYYAREKNIFPNLLKILNNNQIILDAEYINIFSSLIMFESYDTLYFPDNPLDLLKDKIEYGKDIYDFKNRVFF